MRAARRLLHPELALVVVSFVVALAALELGVRLWLPARTQSTLPHVGLDDQDQNRLRWLERRTGSGQHGRDGDLGFDQPDALLGWAPIPNLARRSRQPESFDVQVHTTVDGIRRATPVRREREPGRSRVAVFGCSQTFGAEVEDGETYSAALESRLDGVEVLNFGVHGYGTDQMLLRYERDGAPYRPDVVIVGFAYYHLQRNLDDFRFFAKPRFVLDGGDLRLLNVPVPTPDEYAATAAVPRPPALLDESVTLRWGWQSMLARRTAGLFDPASSAWTLTRALLARFAREVQANGARLVVVNIEDDTGPVVRALDAAARSDGVTFVNAGAVLRDVRGSGTRLRVPHNAHWGAGGHAVIARELAAALCRDGLVPASACPERR